MHLILLFLALLIAWSIRQIPVAPTGGQQTRWQRSLVQFLLPPLLLLMTALSLVCMGPQGQMVRRLGGWFSYDLAVVFLVVGVALAAKLLWEGWRSLRQVRSYPQQELFGTTARLLPTPVPFAAQVGFWRSELVISQGLLDTFDAEHLEAILSHEQAHYYFHDTFWFFWLGWLRRLTCWLPQTETLWQELLLLREQRADRWATQQVDGLLLAESLFQMVSKPGLELENFAVAFGADTPPNRLHERINALLNVPELVEPEAIGNWFFLALALLPLISIPFHY